jgi:hypothetical protein
MLEPVSKRVAGGSVLKFVLWYSSSFFTLQAKTKAIFA